MVFTFNFKSKHVFHLVAYFIISIIIMSSCVTSKSAMALTESYDYKIKQIHVENLNSSYDNLVLDYYEDRKSNDEKFAEAFARDTLAHLRKTSCFGRCPVYRITVFNNGKVKYEGEINVDLIGIYESKLEADQMVKLKDLMGKMDLLRMYNRYPRGVTMEADIQLTKMVLSNGVYKFPTTINYGAPQELSQIQLYLEQLRNELSWVQI